MKPKISLIKIFIFTIGVSITTSKDICLVGGLFFVFVFCHVRRCPKTGFWSFKKNFPVYPSTSNIFRGMNYWIFRSIWIIWLGQRLKYGELGEAVKFLSWFRFDVSFFFAKPIFRMYQNYTELKFLRALIFCEFFFSQVSNFRVLENPRKLEPR